MRRAAPAVSSGFPLARKGKRLGFREAKQNPPFPRPTAAKRAGLTVIPGRSLRRVVVLLENAGFQKLVDQLLHAVERGEESLGRHNDAERGGGSRRLPVGARLERDEVKTNHIAGEMNLADAVDEIFFFHLKVFP